MKAKFLKVSEIRRFFKEANKQVSKEAIEQIDYAVLRVLIRAVAATKNFRRVTDKEVSIVTSSLSRFPKPAAPARR